METKNQKLRSYFLETLLPIEVEEVELQIISDEEFSADIDAAETALMEDYLEDSLTGEERDLFETKFLVTEARQKRLDFLKSLKKIAKSTPQNPIASDNPPSFFEFLKTFFSPRKFAVGFGLIILILAAGVVWRGLLPANDINSEVARVNQRDLSNIVEFKNSTNLNLSAGNLRSGENGNNLDSKNLTDNIFFRLALPSNTPLDSEFQIKLLQDKNVVFTMNNRRIYQNESGQDLRVIIPANLLKKGEYQIELEKENSKDSKMIYNFAVR